MLELQCRTARFINTTIPASNYKDPLSESSWPELDSIKIKLSLEPQIRQSGIP